VAPGELVVPVSIVEIYSSSNGDRWKLIQDTESGRSIVRHIANPSSGGAVTDMDVLDFLSQEGSGPEYSALRLLLLEERPFLETGDHDPLQVARPKPSTSP
jgi:hypothetical protein